MAKLAKTDKRKKRKAAEKELEQQILMEAQVRGNFHRALKRWLERPKAIAETNPVDKVY
jgi:hypothetical protein